MVAVGGPPPLGVGPTRVTVTDVPDAADVAPSPVPTVDGVVVLVPADVAVEVAVVPVAPVAVIVWRNTTWIDAVLPG